MKILIIRNYPSYMSVRNNTYNIQEVGLAKALVKKGHICDIVFWTNKKEETINIPVDNFGSVRIFYRHGKTLLKNTVFLHSEELFEQYDILQPCEYNQMQSWILAKKYSKKVIIYHGPYYSPFNRRYNLMCKVFDMFFVKRYKKQNTKFLVKSNLANDFLIEKGIDKRNVHTVGVGIDTQMLMSCQVSCNDLLYQEMNQDKNSIKLLYVGRIEERRNFCYIIDIFHRIQQVNKESKLYVIGTGERKYMNDCFSYIKALGLENNIVWQDKMEQRFLADIYTMADFFLLPTEYEIFGMVLLEAMYYKTVVLTTYNGGSSTLIHHGVNGFILKDKDPNVWANCILQLDIEKKQSICDNAHQTIKNMYTWDSLVDKFAEQYSEKLSK